MRIELERLLCPEFAEEVECHFCERPFTLGLVIARALTESRMDCGEVCRECATHLGRGPMAASGKFPVEEDFERMALEWGTPKYASAADLDAEWEAEWREYLERAERSESK